MKKFFKYLSALTLGAVLFTSCDMNKLPVFDDKDAYVAFNSGTASVAENAGSVNIPVTLASLKGLSATVSVEGVDGTAKNGVNYVVETSSLSFSATAPTQYVTVKIIDNPGNFTGDIKFTLKFANTGDVNAGAENSCVITINDLDHPLTSILGTYTASAESYFNGPSKFTVTFMKDAGDPYKVWIDNFLGDASWAGDDMLVYGNVDTELTAITIPFGQMSEYKYSNGSNVEFMGVDAGLNGYSAGEGNWTIAILDGGAKLTVDYGVWAYIDGAGSINVLLPEWTMVKD